MTPTTACSCGRWTTRTPTGRGRDWETTPGIWPPATGGSSSWRAVVPVLAALFLIGVAGGLYIVPLYSWLQDYCPSATRSRTIAAGCILDALFMVAASFLYNAASGLGGAVLLVPAGAALAFAGIQQLLRD